jgi:Domain of unknown function (DUF4440)
MRTQVDALIRLNEAINTAENAGDLAALDRMTAARLAFRRRDGTVVDRDVFLAAAKPGQRRLQIESVQVFGARAVVACTVTDGAAVTHNLRLFVQEGDDWKLLGWANAPVA